MDLKLPATHPPQKCESEKCQLRCTMKGGPLDSQVVGSGAKNLLVLIGTAPTWKEENKPSKKLWVDPLGDLMMNFAGQMKLTESCLVMLTKSLRCKTLQGQGVKISQAKQCMKFVMRDIKLVLDEEHQVENIILFCMGSVPAKVYGGGLTLSQGFGCQGNEVEEMFGRKTVCFYTHNPVLITPGFKPHLINSVITHWEKVSDWVDGKVTGSSEIEFKLAHERGELK